MTCIHIKRMNDMYSYKVGSRSSVPDEPSVLMPEVTL